MIANDDIEIMRNKDHFFTTFQTSVDLKNAGFIDKGSLYCWAIDYPTSGNLFYKQSDIKLMHRLQNYIQEDELICLAYNVEFLLDVLPSGTFINKTDNSYQIMMNSWSHIDKKLPSVVHSYVSLAEGMGKYILDCIKAGVITI